MNPLIKRLAHEAVAPLEEMLARLIRTAALIAMATGCAIAASVFLTVDLFLYLQGLWGSLAAASCVAALYLVGAIIFLVLALRRPSPAPSASAPSATIASAPPVMAAASVGAQAAPPSPPNAAFAANIDAAVAPVLGVLREAGLEKEVIAIEAGAEVVKQLNPFSLVAFAVGAGVFLGRTLGTKRTLF
ncbi:conserved membrane hypothetical protein [Methylocella tundrae]|uniref:Holin-X, holin superfamily III n=1 Tax=Methylocella tundrae TaxID=227605 RepID=A0A8B6MC29_METTU|nr:phage holin family protein [Methylocella tundrae]VTZ21443.1 conserved membrane hypothetical protein [Methylocella tundrae]VTZ51576.1 conserved membrane hypothetical protein [Methylocella tundrae]